MHTTMDHIRSLPCVKLAHVYEHELRPLHRLRRIKPNANPLVLVLLHAVLTMASKPAARCGERILAYRRLEFWRYVMATTLTVK